MQVNPLGRLTLSGVALGLQRQELHGSDIAMERVDGDGLLDPVVAE